MFVSATKALIDGDLQTWQTDLVEDATFMPPRHPSISGLPALVEFARESLGDFESYDLSNWIEGTGELAVVTTDIAWSHEGGDKTTGKQVVIAVKDESGDWKAQKVIYNSNSGAP